MIINPDISQTDKEEDETRLRNPKWEKDEVILALDIYYKLDSGQIHARNPLEIERLLANFIELKTNYQS